MDLITEVLSFAPAPPLKIAFSLFRFIFQHVQRAQASKEQLVSLASTIAQLLLVLNGEYETGKLVEANTSAALNNLCGLLSEIVEFVQKEDGREFLKLIFTKDTRIARIDGLHRKLGAAVDAFQISALLDVQKWQARNSRARVEDQQVLVRLLSDLQASQSWLAQLLAAREDNIMAMMISLRRRLDQQLESDNPAEYRFFSDSFQYLSTSSGRIVEPEDWMITTYEVEFGNEIGSGGFSHVFRGEWRRMSVALKVLKTAAGVTPSSSFITDEVKTWSKLRHPHILQFLGANVLDDRPFIVTPFLQNGNARDYIRRNLTCDRIKLVRL